jgi:hypothetical protein
MKKTTLLIGIGLLAIGLNGCSGLMPQNNLTADYTGDFTVDDCVQLAVTMLNDESYADLARITCAQQLGQNGQEAFNKQMRDILSGVEDLNNTLQQMQDPDYWANLENSQ